MRNIAYDCTTGEAVHLTEHATHTLYVRAAASSDSLTVPYIIVAEVCSTEIWDLYKVGQPLSNVKVVLQQVPQPVKVERMVSWRAEWGAVESRNPATALHERAFQAYALEHRIRKSGNWHQESEAGVPVFSDGAVLFLSQRRWGHLMADIWSEAEGKHYSYVDFYMYEPDEVKV